MRLIWMQEARLLGRRTDKQPHNLEVSSPIELMNAEKPDLPDAGGWQNFAQTQRHSRTLGDGDTTRMLPRRIDAQVVGAGQIRSSAA
jgi:hypothetical protein